MNDMVEVNRKIEEALKEEGLLPRGQKLVGKVVSTKMRRTVSVEIERVRKDKKYKKYFRQHSKIKAHVPKGIEVREGDIVEIRETRKISKTKSFVVYKILSRGE